MPRDTHHLMITKVSQCEMSSGAGHRAGTCAYWEGSRGQASAELVAEGGAKTINTPRARAVSTICDLSMCLVDLLQSLGVQVESRHDLQRQAGGSLCEA